MILRNASIAKRNSMDFSKIKKIYMIGVKGVGMTMLGQYLAAQGAEVSGSDGPEKYMTDQVLAKAGIKVVEHFNAANIPREADLIIYSTAYKAETNVEVAAALTGKVKTLTYAQALGEVFNQKYGLAVVGSHGKTTTTAWLAFVMQKAGLESNAMVGARVPQFNGCSLVGQSDYLLIEADEYQNKLKYYEPKAALLNNIDYDHPDFFPSAADYKNVFVEFIKKIPVKGFLVANLDDAIIRKIARVNCRAKVITYAIDEAADYVAYDIKSDGLRQYFKVKLGVGSESSVPDATEAAASGTLLNDLGDFSIQLSGRHNIYNALAVIAASIELDIELFKIRKYLEEFSGAERRMQVLGEFKGAVIIDDYAHHPAEIKATLEAVRQKYGPRNLIAAFHPHTYSRTKALLGDFSKSFDQADGVIILDIYGSAREKQGGVSSLELVEKLRIRNQELGIRQEVEYIPTLKECEKYLRQKTKRDDVILLMGAGDIFRVGENLVKK